MPKTLSSRIIAEHLSTLARLLEAEAARAAVLGLQPARDLGAEAREVRGLSDLLWQADLDFPVDAAAGTGGQPAANVVSIGAARH